MPQPYHKIITAKAITQRGLFTVHKVDDHFYFEIPDSLLNTDILIVNRIFKAAVEMRPDDLGYAGDEVGRNIVNFCRGLNNKIFLKWTSFFERSIDSSDNGMYRALSNSNFLPIAVAFDIKAISPDSNSVVIDVTDYLNSENDLFSFSPAVKKKFQFGAFQKDKSYVEEIKAFPRNVEIQTLCTYRFDPINLSYLINSSIISLPKSFMQPRFYDERVGYFSTGYFNYDKNPQRVEATWMINRWRLEPKDEDVEKYKRGELVEPKKPIVYYIDPATPKKWVPYLIQGVNDWQKAFEKAGFKNAIFAMEVPKDDSGWSIDDARYNVIVYKPSRIANASGPIVFDPRTGEIIETHINWYHNVMELLHNWYMIQAGPNDPKARKMDFDDSLMGQLIRFVSSHEVGHTLGLMHNFGASTTIPTDSLRSKNYVEKNGFCPSIMDYARFNYVAQPEDHISEKGIFPRIGVYDEWAIEWGYKWLPQLQTEKEEKIFMDKWIIDRISKDQRLRFGYEGYSSDPRFQSEDIGDDAVKSGTYGIKNLQRVMSNLIDWTYKPATNYADLATLQKEVMNQYKRYLYHVADCIGGVERTAKTREQGGDIVSFPSREQKRKSIQFLNDQLFSTPSWLLDKKLFRLTAYGTSYDLLLIQKQMMEKLVSNSMFISFEFSRFNNPAEAYSVDELLTDLEKGIFKELKTNGPIDIYRRNLQKEYVVQLINVVLPGVELGKNYGEYSSLPWSNITDVHALVKAHIKELLKRVDDALLTYKDKMTRLHLLDVKEKITLALDTIKYPQQQRVTQPNKQAINIQPTELNQEFDEKTFFRGWKPCTIWDFYENIQN